MSGIGAILGGGFSPLSLIGPLLSLAMGGFGQGGGNNAPSAPPIPPAPAPAPVPAPVALPTIEPIASPDTSVEAAQASNQGQKRAALSAQAGVSSLNAANATLLAPASNNSNGQRSLLGG